MFTPSPEVPGIPAQISLSSVIWKKIIAWADRHTFRRFAFAVGEAFLFLAMFGILISPEGAARTLRFLLTSGHYFLIKMALAFLVVKYRALIWESIRGIGRTAQVEDAAENFEGIPVTELIHFLFSTGGFRFQESKKTFQLTRGEYDRISVRLETLGVLVRGESNARILNEELTRQEIAEIIASGSILKVFHSGRPQTMGKEDIRNDLQGVFAIRSLKE